MGISNFLSSKGITRDDAKWVWLKVAGLAGVVIALGWDGGALMSFASYIGIPLSVVNSHRIIAGSVALLWLAGEFDASKLPGAKSN